MPETNLVTIRGGAKLESRWSSAKEPEIAPVLSSIKPPGKSNPRASSDRQRDLFSNVAGNDRTSETSEAPDSHTTPRRRRRGGRKQRGRGNVDAGPATDSTSLFNRIGTRPQGEYGSRVESTIMSPDRLTIELDDGTDEYNWADDDDYDLPPSLSEQQRRGA